MTYWCAAHTHINSEDVAAGHLIRQGFEVLLPKHLKRRAHARRVDWVPKPLFPGYLFVAIDPDRSPWRAIKGTVGIRDVIRFGEKPAAVPDPVINEIRTRQDDDGLIRTRSATGFKQGDTVQVKRGSLGELEALFEGTDERNRVIVLLDLLGRKVRATVSGDAVFAI